jgi:hypothetical protein
VIILDLTFFLFVLSLRTVLLQCNYNKYAVNMPHRIVFLTIFLFTLLISCKSDRFKEVPSNKIPMITYLNLAKELRGLDSSQYTFFDAIESKKYGESYAYFIGYCLKIGNPGDSLNKNGLATFYRDPYIKRLEKHLAKGFDNTKKIEEKLNLDFQRLNFYAPSYKIPKKITFLNSLFTSSVNSMDTDIAVGIERYLGPEYDVIKELPEEQFFAWIKVKMQPKFMERDILVSWIQTHLVPQNNTNTAEAIVNWGKTLFIAEVALQAKMPSTLLRYSDKEFTWATEREISFWKYLINENILFSKSERDIQNLLVDAPFTIGLPEKGADRMGQFLGWKIVHAFMNENDKVSLQELIETPYNKILQAYKQK